MLQGKKGVKYGLQLPARPPSKQARKPQASISAFQEGSDDEDTIGRQIARQQAKISTDVKVRVLCVAGTKQLQHAARYPFHGRKCLAAVL